MGKTIAKIYLSNFEHNINEIKRIAPKKKICLAIKANAYGHGLVEIAQKAVDLNLDFLSVATVNEGIKLRKANINIPILLLSLCHINEIKEIVTYSLTPLVADKEFIDSLDSELLRTNTTNFPIHIKLDTGMSRHGVCEEFALDLAKYIITKNNIRIEGTCTHFAVSDSLVEEDIAFTKNQLCTFNSVVSTLEKNKINPGILHCAASGGILLHPDSHFDMVRPGILAYGYFPDRSLLSFFESKQKYIFKPVMELVSYITTIKPIEKGKSVSYGRKWIASIDTTIATLSTGYGDGYSRSLSNKTFVTINGLQYPVIGRICMDQCVVHIGEDISVRRWDEAVLFGPQKECNSAMDIADILKTIPYEILCAVSERVDRVYI